MTSTNIPLKMVRWNLENLPRFPLPAGFGLRPYEAGDEANWTAIHLAADRFNPITPGLFQQQFGDDLRMLAERQVYLVDSAGKSIGTGTAWFRDQFHGRRFGRVHWVALLPEFQGRGLSKPLVSAVCERLITLGHDCAYLSTSSVRVAAIRLYQRFGFEPLIENEQQAGFWRAWPG